VRISETGVSFRREAARRVMRDGVSTKPGQLHCSIPHWDEVLYGREPDEGIWEIRGKPQHFTYSKVSAWTALDRAIKFVEQTGHRAPLERWRRVRDEIHAEVCAKGFDKERNTFVQYYGAKGLDASLLLIPITGFLPATDPRMLGTIDSIQQEICNGPFVWRYSTEEDVDGLAGSEGTFLICSFWLVSALALAGRVEDAERNLEQLRALNRPGFAGGSIP